jgi:predicted nuclease of restriction endonuclease-like (RecB) superfamily
MTSKKTTASVTSAKRAAKAQPVAVLSGPGNFSQLVTSIEQAHTTLAARAAQAVNVSLTLRNWLIGLYIAEFELQGADRAQYGDKLIDALETILQQRKVSTCGRRQLYNYLTFYRSYPQIVRTASAQSTRLIPDTAQNQIVRTVSAQLPTDLTLDPELLLSRLSYSHFEQLLELEEPLKRSFYEIETLRGNWSVRELKRQIATQYFERSGLSKDKAALATLAHARAETQSAQQLIRDPYIFEFLGLIQQEVMGERGLEEALLDKLQSFLLELGHGFCFEARQKRLLIGGEHFYVDLVFYHRILKCHVLIELKNDSFKHEHLGQLNSYVGYYRQEQMTAGDQAPIGILLCTGKNEDMVQYALSGMTNNLFVSRYQLALPEKEEIAAFLQRAMQELAGVGTA